MEQEREVRNTADVIVCDRRLKPFIDDVGRVKQLPAKGGIKRLVLAHLALKFEEGKTYLEQDVNGILSMWHTFGDYFLLRRELIDGGFLGRTSDGAEYWREQQEFEKEEEQSHENTDRIKA